ncbi:uncharacterized protein [Atheta coriaria]|uniref:uncharacterized protein isoform X3 n=1 Tax=Dalotia coriaria TaxID=877792 RepID=UPI0031F3CA61
MKWSGFCLLATLAVLCLLDGHKTSAAPSPRTDDLLKTLQDLEQIYSSMARPSVRSGSVIEPEMSKKVQRAMKMIEMQRLERLYAHRARPRFGKRDRLINNNGIYRSAESDYADDQLPMGWVATRR